MSNGFRQQLDRAFEIKVIRPIERRVRAVALTLDTELVLNTPVDTGRARANWQAGINRRFKKLVPWNDTEKKDESFVPARSKSALSVIGRYTIDKTIYITNNLPYIQRLNDGYSKQAASGFVDAAVARAKRALK